jgi:hypothetical protein
VGDLFRKAAVGLVDVQDDGVYLFFRKSVKRRPYGFITKAFYSVFTVIAADTARCQDKEGEDEG